MNVIYLLRSPSGKVYIGKSTNYKKRWAAHKHEAESGRPGYLYGAIRKYGWDSFEKEVLEVVEKEENLSDREIFWISQFNAMDRKTGYNLNPGGTGGNVWKYLSSDQQNQIRETVSKQIHTEENKAKQRASIKKTIQEHGHWSKGRSPWNKGKKLDYSPWNKGKSGYTTSRTLSDEERAKVGERFRKPKTEEHKQKLREANLGKVISEETRQKISKTSTGRIEKEHTCPYCGKTGKSGAMYRWHFDRCKKRENTDGSKTGPGGQS